MGLFLAMSGIANATEARIEDALREYAQSHRGKLTECPATEETWEFLILSERQPGRVTVVYPGAFMDWDDAAAHLSRSLNVPVFSFHIHDDDLWMYVLFADGEEMDHFNPIPDYWSDDLPDEERELWAGSAEAVARHWPNIQPDAIEDYLTPWNLDESPERAYPNDEFPSGDCWQLMDFMRRLGLDYPVDDRGQPHGRTFRFEVEGM